MELSTPNGSAESKLVLPVKLSNDKIREWIPNKTSIKEMVLLWGDNTEQWNGKMASFKLAQQNVRGEMKDIIFVEGILSNKPKQ